MTNPNDSEMRLLSVISWTVQRVFDTAPAAGAGSLTTAVTFPTDSSLSTFRRFSCLPDPDHILPHCGEGNILQWVEKFRALIVGRAESHGVKLPSKRLKLKCCNDFCYTAVLCLVGLPLHLRLQSRLVM